MADKNIRQRELDKIKQNMKFKKKRKRRIIIPSIVLAATILIGVFTNGCGSFKKKSNNRTNIVPPKDKITNSLDDSELFTGSLNDLGVELEFPKDEKTEYANSSGNIDVNMIVEDSNSTSWVNEEAESKKDEVGNKVIDTKGGTLEVKSDGDVYEKEEGYQIIDKDGNVKEEGNLDSDSLPSGFEQDKDTDKILDDNHANTGLYVAPDGSLWSSEQEYLDTLKEAEITNTETEFIPMDSVIVEESTSNATSQPATEVTEPSKPIDTTKPSTGTYYDELSGLTFQSKEHYDQWVLQDFEGYGIVNGIMVPKTNEMEKADVKVLTK